MRDCRKEEKIITKFNTSLPSVSKYHQEKNAPGKTFCFPSTPPNIRVINNHQEKRRDKFSVYVFKNWIANLNSIDLFCLFFCFF